MSRERNTPSDIFSESAAKKFSQGRLASKKRIIIFAVGREERRVVPFFSYVR